MEINLDKERKEDCQSETLISQPLELESTPQHVLNTILWQIGKATEEQCLEFTVSIEDAHLILESLDSDADFESRKT